MPPTTGKGADATAQAAIEAITSNPVFLFLVTATDGTIWRYARNSDVDITYPVDGDLWLAAGIDQGEIAAALDGSVDQLSLTVDITPELRVYIANGGRINGARVEVTRVFRDYLDDPLHRVPEFTGGVDGGSLEGGLSITLKRAGGAAQMRVPRGNYGPGCWKRFKSLGAGLCNYMGEEDSCDRTGTRCDELGNTANFGGCRFVVKKPPEHAGHWYDSHLGDPGGGSGGLGSGG